MTMKPVFVLGGAQSDFARNLAREGLGLAELTAELVDATLASAGLEPAQIDAIHVGNAFGELFTGQAQLGALPATVRPALAGCAAARHEGACASGSLAVLAGMTAIQAGHADAVLVLGVEQERNVPGELAARHLGAAAWIGREGQDARFMWPAMFSRLAEVYAERHGLDERHLAAIAANNFAAARRNPKAQTRAWSFPEDAFTTGWQDPARNPVVEGRVRRLDCGQVTDGGAGVVLVSERLATRDAVPIFGFGQRTGPLSLEAKLASSSEYLIPHLRQTILDAGIRDPRELDGIELHDCFTITEYLLLDHLGFAPPGQPWRAIEDGVLARVNPSGGLIGLGHPVGATGVRMLADAAAAVRAGARRFATLNIGGSATTCVAFVLGVPS